MNHPNRRLTDTSVVRLGLQPGATMQRGGKTFVLNEHHRWTLPKQKAATQNKPRSMETDTAKEPKQPPPQQQTAKAGSQQAPQAKSQAPEAQPGSSRQFDKATGRKLPGSSPAQSPTSQPAAEKPTTPKQPTDRPQAPQGSPSPQPQAKQPSNQQPASQPKQPQSDQGDNQDDDEPIGPPIDAKVDADFNHDGITDQARVGVPANLVPPPPGIPRIKSLTKKQAKIQEDFCKWVENDPDQAVNQALALITNEAHSKGRPPTFETDQMKVLNKNWDSDELSQNLSQRSANRAKYNTALHQAANALCKKAFVEYVKTLKPGDEILVTVGGCGAGKGYSLAKDKDGKPFVPEAQELMRRAAVVWDSAGDQNATENTWLRDVANNHGLKLSFLFVHNDPYKSWAGEMGAVNRAMKPDNGRMVDAKVFVDSYVIGAKNHANFLAQHSHDANISSVIVDCSSGKPVKTDRMPETAIELDSKQLEQHCIQTIQQRNDVPDYIRQAALQGQKIWSK
jgi:flagellar biosynthesis GTPase FlhF